MRIRFTPGVKPSVDAVFALKVFDPHYSEDGDGTENLLYHREFKIIGEVRGSKYTLLTTASDKSTKDGTVMDFGKLAVISPAYAAIIAKSPPRDSELYAPRSLKLKNSGSYPAAFVVSRTNQASEVCVYPPIGTIPPNGGIAEVLVWISPSKPSQGVVSDNVILSILGSSKVLKINVLYQCDAPAIQITHSNPLFGEDLFAVGSTAKGEIAIQNVGEVTGRIYFDLRNFAHLDLHIERAGKEKPKTSSTSNSYVPTQSALKNRRKSTFGNRAASQSATTYSDAVDFHSVRLGEDDDVLVDECRGNRNQKTFVADKKFYVLEVAPSQTAALSLVFKPMTDGPQTFSIPVYLIGYGSSTNIREAFYNIPINVTTVQPVLTISKTALNFPEKYINPKIDKSISIRPYLPSKETFTLTNQSDAPLDWWLDVETEDENPTFTSTFDLQSTTARSALSGADARIFKFDVVSGNLAPGQSQTVVATFHPVVVGRYEASLPVFIGHDNQVSSPYSLDLKGLGLEPSIAFDPPELFIPIVPLGQEVSVSFSIINYGCDRNELAYALSEDVLSMLANVATKPSVAVPVNSRGSKEAPRREAALPVTATATTATVTTSTRQVCDAIELVFPEGKLLKNDRERLSVTLKFRSLLRAPMSFTTHMRFQIEHPTLQTIGVPAADAKTKRLFFLPIHATADCSLLTLWPFMEMNRERYAFHVKTVSQPLINKRLEDFADGSIVYESATAEGIVVNQSK
jgi:hypothetical protein